jgi:hypothetical protein
MRMTQTKLEQEESLGQFLASRARDLSDSRLAGNAIAAALMAVGVAAWRGPLWDVRIGVALCILAFGVWGVADRDLEQDATASRRKVMGLSLTRLVAATVGFSAAAYVMMALLARAIGKVIS